MKKAQLSGSLRANVGKKDAASLRSENRVPCVLYGQGEQTHFSVKRVDLDKIIFSPEVYQVELDIEGKSAVGIVREVQQHPVKDTLQHVDFYELNDSKKVRVDLPVRTKGAAKGVLNGGKLNMAFRTLSCFGLPGDLPDAITLNIAPIRIGQSIRVSEVSIPGVTILDPANAVVLGVKISRGAVDDEEEEEEEAVEGAEGAEGEGAKEEGGSEEKSEK